MKLQHVIAVLLVAQTATVAASAADGFQISPLLGKSTVAIDAPSLISGNAVEDDMVRLGVQLRYVAPVGFLVEAGYDGQNNDSWDNRDRTLRLTQYTAAVGWQFETAHGFRITPKAGRARWDLYSEDGQLTQVTPGTNPRRGYDNYWELSLQKTITKSVALGVLFKDSPYQFGNVKSIAFTASFAL
jgi:hypothetical protein